MTQAPTLETAARSGTDNILPLRHLAALLVIFGHGYALSLPQAGRIEPLGRLLPGFYAGSLAVYLFFAISGYLVTLSLLRHPGLLRYAWHRILRIFPAYLACLLLTVFVLGLCFTTLAPAAYLQHPETWHYLHDNLLPISLSWNLPGVFASNAYPDVVNGSLWSLGLEVRWYFYLGLLAALTVVRRRLVFTAIALLLIGHGAWEWQAGKPDPLHYRALSQTFLLAALAAQWRSHIRLSHAVMAGMLLAVLLAHGTRWLGPALVACIMYGVLWAAYRVPTLPWPRGIDYSYGLFLYGFPVQQVLVALFPSIPPWPLAAAATVVAGIVAALSWHWVERPALRWKHRSRGRQAAAT